MESPTIEALTLTCFRNYEHAHIEPGSGFNIVAGQNAQGKTNLIEAVGLVSTGRVMRGSRDTLAIMNGKDVAKVEAVLTPSGTMVAVELRRGVRKRALLNGAGLPRASDLLGRIPSVSFSAADLAIVRGDPSDRRHFLDTELAQLYPAYLRHLSVYKRALEQRNALLKESQESARPGELFEALEAQLAEHGDQIRRIRDEWVAGIAPLVVEEHAGLASSEPVGIGYVRRDDAALCESLQDTRWEDVRRGFTSVGPHRDDLQIDVGGVDARQFGSQGQQRTAVIAIKLAALRSATAILGFPPVLLLDDVFSDLDQGRRARLVERSIDMGGEAFLTCTEPEQAGDALVGSAKVFRVVSGTVEAL